MKYRLTSLVNLLGIGAIVVLSLLSPSVGDELSDPLWIALACIGLTVWCWGSVSLLKLTKSLDRHQRWAQVVYAGALLVFIVHSVIVGVASHLPEIGALLIVLMDYPACFPFLVAKCRWRVIQFACLLAGGIWYTLVYCWICVLAFSTAGMYQKLKCGKAIQRDINNC